MFYRITDEELDEIEAQIRAGISGDIEATTGVDRTILLLLTEVRKGRALAAAVRLTIPPARITETVRVALKDFGLMP